MAKEEASKKGMTIGEWVSRAIEQASRKSIPTVQPGMGSPPPSAGRIDRALANLSYAADRSSAHLSQNEAYFSQTAENLEKRIHVLAAQCLNAVQSSQSQPQPQPRDSTPSLHPQGPLPEWLRPESAPSPSVSAPRQAAPVFPSQPLDNTYAGMYKPGNAGLRVGYFFLFLSFLACIAWLVFLGGQQVGLEMAAFRM
jgi:hypothetical protein